MLGLGETTRRSSRRWPTCGRSGATYSRSASTCSRAHATSRWGATFIPMSSTDWAEWLAAWASPTSPAVRSSGRAITPTKWPASIWLAEAAAAIDRQSISSRSSSARESSIPARLHRRAVLRRVHPEMVLALVEPGLPGPGGRHCLDDNHVIERRRRLKLVLHGFGPEFVLHLHNRLDRDPVAPAIALEDQLAAALVEFQKSDVGGVFQHLLAPIDPGNDVNEDQIRIVQMDGWIGRISNACRVRRSMNRDVG